MKSYVKNLRTHFNIFVVVCILSLGYFIYSYKIGDIPSGLALDEVSHGYNAYSLLLTGKDEYGKTFPISFRFFNAYAPPLYTYLTVPLVWLFGLGLTSTRMLSVISGVGSILVVFLLLKKVSVTENKIMPYLGAFLYSISPWSIMYSRSGYEAMLSFLIYSLGVLSIWIGFSKQLFLTIGLILFSISVYASYTNKFLIPLLFLGLVLVLKNTVLEHKNRKFLIYGLIGALVIQIPNLLIINTQSFLVKGDLFYRDTLFAEYQRIKDIAPTFIGLPYVFLREFLSQYFTYLSPRSLFLDPDPFPARSIPDLSVFYSWMVIPYLIGIYTIWRRRNLLNYQFLLLLTLIAPIPATLTKDPFWTYRAIPLLLPLIMIITIGIDRILNIKFKILAPLAVVLILYSLVVLWKGYFILMPNERAEAWQYGYQQLANEISLNKSDKFIVDNTRSPQAYMELAFFLNLPPQELQYVSNQKIKNDYYNDVHLYSDYSFRNIEIRRIIWETDTRKSQILVGDSLTFSESQVREHKLTPVFNVKNFLGNIIFTGYRTNPF